MGTNARMLNLTEKEKRLQRLCVRLRLGGIGNLNDGNLTKPHIYKEGNTWWCCDSLYSAVGGHTPQLAWRMADLMSQATGMPLKQFATEYSALTQEMVQYRHA